MLSRILILLTLILGLCTEALAQYDTTKIRFDYYVYDFGAITEGTAARCSFYFTNPGKDTIRLSHGNLKSSCGCVTIEYTQTPVAPGERGYIIANMYTLNRVGSFNKAIYYYPPEGRITAIYLMGVILAPAKDTVFTRQQLKASSNISIDRTEHSFGKVKKDQELKTSFLLKNTGKDTLQLKYSAGCHCVLYRLQKKDGTEISSLLPDETAELKITYTPHIVGPVSNRYVIETNSLSTPVLILTLNAEILPE